MGQPMIAAERGGLDGSDPDQTRRARSQPHAG
jgi:hypothetical protein